MSTVLVTGGAGFLGSHIADALTARGHQVRIFDTRPSSYRQPGQQEFIGDITNADDVSRAVEGCDYVYHLAAIADLNAAKTRPVDTVRINIGGTLNILEACRIHRVKRLMFASTVYVYSREGGFYRCSKQACESYIEQYRQSYGLNYCVLRYGSLYGLRADASNGVYRFMKQAIQDRKISYGGLATDLRSYIHVGDAANLSVDALDEAYADQHLIITGHDGVRVGDLFQMFREMLGYPVQVDYVNSAQQDSSTGQGGHYSITPYAFTPRPGKKLTTNHYVDIGQGMLQVLEQVHNEIENKS